MFSWVFSVQMQNKNNHHCIFSFHRKNYSFQCDDTMKKIHLNAVKIFLFLVTAILNEGLSSSGEIKVKVLVIINRGKGGRQIISVSGFQPIRIQGFQVDIVRPYCSPLFIGHSANISHCIFATVPTTSPACRQPVNQSTQFVDLDRSIRWHFYPYFLLNMAYQFVCGILEDLENKIRHLQAKFTPVNCQSVFDYFSKRVRPQGGVFGSITLFIAHSISLQMPEYERYSRAVYTRENKPQLTIAV